MNTEIEENENIVQGRLEYILSSEYPELIYLALSDSDVYKIDSSCPPAVIILDCFIEENKDLSIVSYIKSRYRDTKVILITDKLQEDLMIKGFEAGIDAYILKKEDHDELILAINKAKNGEKYICSEASYMMLERIKEVVNSSINQAPIEINLSSRELEVLQLISQGLTNNEIAEKIFTSRRTVETHRKTLIEKTKTKNTAALIKFAMTNKIIK